MSASPNFLEIRQKFYSTIFKDSSELIPFLGVNSNEAQDILDVYRNTVIEGLKERLEAIYGDVKYLLSTPGELINLIEDYVHRYPSFSGNLYDYGEEFINHLPKEYQDVGRILWHLEASDFWPNPTPFNNLSQIEQDGRLILSKHIIIESPSSSYFLWSKINSHQPIPKNSNIQKPQNILIYRQGFIAMVRLLDDYEVNFIKMVNNQSSLQEIFTKLGEDKKSAQKFSNSLAGLSKEGLIAGFEAT